MKLSELRQIIKEIMSDEEIVATLKKQLDPKSTVKVTKPVVKPNVIYTDKMNEVEINGKIVRTYTQNGDKSYNVTYDDGTTDRIAVSNDAWDKINMLHMNATKVNEEFRRMRELAGIVNEFYAPNYIIDKYGEEKTKEIEQNIFDAEEAEGNPNLYDLYTSLSTPEETEDFIQGFIN